MQPVKDDCIDRSVILGSVPGSENLFLAGQILFKKMCRFLWLEAEEKFSLMASNDYHEALHFLLQAVQEEEAAVRQH